MDLVSLFRHASTLPAFSAWPVVDDDPATAAPIDTTPEATTATPRATRRIEGVGTSEDDWQAWSGLAAVPTIRGRELLPPGSRAVIVAPHPDDEVLACGGLLAMLAARAGSRRGPVPLALIGVSDGEGSHPGSRRWTPDRLAVTRRAERAEGLKRLGLTPQVTALGLPDGRIAAHREELVIQLLRLLQPRDVIFTTWRLDGHPDHEATGRACAQAATLSGCRLMEMPVWAWHWARPADARVPWHRLRRLPLSADALQRKRAATLAHRSQLVHDGERPPVLSTEAVARWMRSSEYLLLPEADA